LITKKYKYFLFALLMAHLSGCIGIKHLKDDEKLLYRQGIQAPKEIDTENLRELYTQKANRKILSLPLSPLVSIYYWGANNYEQEKYVKKRDKVIKKFDNKIAKATSQNKINNFQFRKQKKVDRLTKMIENGNLRMQWGEPVSVYDSAQTNLTAERIHDFLFSKGYFNNNISFKTTTLGKLESVTYKVDPALPYHLDSIFYQVSDTSIAHLIQADMSNSLLQKGDRYDQDNLTRERDRLDLMLKDHGYFDFSRQYIEYEVDTSLIHGKNVVVLLRILNPAIRGYHKQFKIDSVVFTTDASTKSEAKRTKQYYKNIGYRAYKKNYNFKILTQRVFLKPGALYSRTNTVNTQQQLANLDNFKFVNINYDTANGKFIANIFTSPLDRYQWSNEVGVNVTQGFPGPFDNVNFRKRNVFHGLENFDLTARYGFEGVASATDDQNIYKSTEAGINASLTFPQFLWPLREKTLLKVGRYNPKTKISSGYTFSERPEYTRSTTSINFNYSWERGRSRRFDFTLLNLNIIKSSVRKDFDSLLNKVLAPRGNNLYRSFKPSFVSSMIFGMTWNHNNYGNRDQSSVYFRWQLESGGTLQNFFDYNLNGKNGLQGYRYLRLNADLRKNIIIDKNTSIAYRINGGVAYAYDTAKVLPYEKYFFVGGSNSIRAWRPRRLGPGSLRPDLSKDPVKDGYLDYNFEKPGDILLEASIEYRKHIFGFIEGAVFLDAGNVWNMFPQKKAANETVLPPGDPQFKIEKFYKQIGVGTGFGLRFDFTFLIIRFDVGMKVYDPAREKFVLDRARFFKPYATTTDGGFTNYKEPVIYNFGIGYPF
jgi:outer membrane protein insertion porin family